MNRTCSTLLCMCFLLVFSCQQKKEMQQSTSTEIIPEKEAGQLKQAESVEDKNQQSAQTATTNFPKVEPAAEYSYKIIPAENNTFGYEILQNGKSLIRQNTIPGMPGNKAFHSSAAAEKVSALVISKLQKGEMPPSVTPEEMKGLNVKF